MLTELTPEQEAAIPGHNEAWLSVGLNCNRVNKDEARSAVELLYTTAGLKPPQSILFADGPLHAQKILKENGVSDSVISSVVYGQHEAGWLAFYTFFEDVCKLYLGKKLVGLIAVAKHCGWVNVYDTLAVVHDRPLHVKLDDQKRLHCEDGPAIAYADGFKVYSWHGTRIPSSWIEDKSCLTAKIALTWENIEQRRAACEILGWAQVLKDLKFRIINQDDDPMIGTLLEVNIPDIGKEKFLQVLCGTGRTFAIPVPPEMKTALQANAWTYGLEAENYAPEIRT